MQINSYGNGSVNSYYGSQMISAFLGDSGTDSKTDGLFDFMAEQQSVKVNLALEDVGRKMVVDLAAKTADYLADKPALTEDYVLVIVGEQAADRQAICYRVEDLVAEMEGEEKEKAAEALKENRLLYVNTTEDLPAAPTDEEAAGLAAAAQGYLDLHKGVLDLLEKNGVVPWQ